MARFKQVTIVGLGLIGSSLGMALRKRKLARRVVGLSRSRATCARAKRAGAIDVGTTETSQAVADADVVVLATPVDSIVPYAHRLAHAMKPGALLTDVGSTKRAIVEQLERSLPKHVLFIGGHPVAGSEQRGLEAAEANLFDGAVHILTPTARTPRAALAAARKLWEPLAGAVIVMTPADHDRLLAQTSHLPHLLAYTLAQIVNPAPLPKAPRSFLDMTRIAKSDPDLWDDIFLSNRRELLAAMDTFHHEWHKLRTLLLRGRRAQLHRVLAQGKARRDALHD